MPRYCIIPKNLPNSFKMTIFIQHRMQYEGRAFNTQDFSQIYFYLPSTVDRNEKINKYMTSVNLKPFAISHTEFGDQFNPADLDFDRSVVVELMKKVALQSSQNLKRNADVFFIYCDTRQQQAVLARRKKDPERKIRPHILNTYRLIKAHKMNKSTCCLWIILRAVWAFAGLLMILSIVNNSNMWTSGCRNKNRQKLRCSVNKKYKIFYLEAINYRLFFSHK